MRHLAALVRAKILTITAQILAAHGANLNAADAQGDTPLANAALQGHSEAVSELIALGACVKTHNASGKSPFDLATGAGHTAVAECLAHAGGDAELLKLSAD